MGSDNLYADLEFGFRRDLQEPQSNEIYTCRIDLRFRLPGSDGETDLLDGARPSASFDMQPFRGLITDAEAYGRRLGQVLFADAALVAGFAKAQFSARQQGVRLRVRLAIPSTLFPLHALHWEKLILPDEPLPLSHSETVLVSRYLTSPDPRPIVLPKPRDVRALVVIARPTNLTQYGLADIKVADELLSASTALQATHFTQLTDGRATLDAIRDEIRGGHDLVYIVAHGKMVHAQPWICLENANREIEWVSGQNLAAMIGALERLPKLVVLTSCASAGVGQTGDAGVLAALGPLLVRAGVPAVIAMQGNVLQETAAQFMPVFFGELNRSGCIDQAMAIARSKVRKQSDWWAPVLFMRLRSGLLFDTAQLTVLKEPDAETVHQALAKLNYTPQTKRFRRDWRKRRGAFLISGQDSRSGQRWLLCRLLHSLPAWQQRKMIIKLDFARLQGVTLSAELIWEKVAEQIGVDPQAAPAEVIAALGQRWLENHLLLIFLNVTDCLDILVHEVWPQLMATLAESESNPNQLFMFVTNEDEPLPALDLASGGALADEAENGQPVLLPELPAQFARDEIDDWIYDEQDTLKAIVQSPDLRTDPDELLEEIWAEDEGVPMPTMKTIYGLCMPATSGLRWSKFKKQWTEVY
ncbi:MAG: CHAT domain-containing protein [Caldilineaceae bacterium]